MIDVIELDGQINEYFSSFSSYKQSYERVSDFPFTGDEIKPIVTNFNPHGDKYIIWNLAMDSSLIAKEVSRLSADGYSIKDVMMKLLSPDIEEAFKSRFLKILSQGVLFFEGSRQYSLPFDRIIACLTRRQDLCANLYNIMEQKYGEAAVRKALC